MVFGHSPVSCKHLQAFLPHVNYASFLDCFPEMTKHEQCINKKYAEGDEHKRSIFDYFCKSSMVFGHSPVSCKHLQAFLPHVNYASFLDCFPEMTKHEQCINKKNAEGDREGER